MTFVEFTTASDGSPVSINLDAIGYVRGEPNRTLIMVTGGEGGAVYVKDGYDAVIIAIHKADGDIE